MALTKTKLQRLLNDIINEAQGSIDRKVDCKTINKKQAARLRANALSTLENFLCNAQEQIRGDLQGAGK